MKGKTHKSNRYSILMLLVFFISFDVLAMPDDVSRGALLTENQYGERSEIPLLDTKVQIDITGPIARTTVKQSFKNDSDDWVEALYLFPLPETAAVDHLTMLVGDKTIQGIIQQKQQAKATYESAKAAGKKAALVEQDRPNIFSTSVANIPPHGTIEINIEYQQSIAWRDDAFSLRFPMAITPRYKSNSQKAEFVIDSQSSLSQGWDILPDERPQQLRLIEEETATLERPISIDISLHPGFKIAEVMSPNHKISAQASEGNGLDISLSASDHNTDKDFVLSWKPETNNKPTAAFFSEKKDNENYGLLMLTPPTVEGWQKPSRELIFVIDTSGSMAGNSMRAAKDALLAGLKDLASHDRFNIIDFDDKTKQLFTRSQSATSYNLIKARLYIEGLQADGGTEMFPALEAALLNQSEYGQLRQVVFITDGSVSQEQALFKFIDQNIGNSRLFTVGIGSAPNSYFMAEAAVLGHGTFTYVDNYGDAENSMKQLFNKISQPALTHITVESDQVEQFAPAIIPDLYPGEPLTVAVKLKSDIKQIRIKGQIGNTIWNKTLDINNVGQQKGIAVDWARKMISHWERAGVRGRDSEEVKKAITDIALDYHLVSRFTSLVAVDVTPSRPESEDVKQQVLPAKRPHGLKIQMARTATGYEMTLILGLILLTLGFASLLIRPQQDDVRGVA